MSSVLVFLFGRWCSNFVGSESGQKQSVKLLQNMIYNTTQHPPPTPHPHSHTLSAYSVRMRSSLVVRASDCQCTSCNGPGFDPSAQWNLRDGRWSSAEYCTNKKKRIPQKNIFKKAYSVRLLWEGGRGVGDQREGRGGNSSQEGSKNTNMINCISST